MAITSANAVFTLTIPSIYPVPQQLQMWAADDAFSVDSIQIAETRMGVDGKLSAGFTPAIVPVTLTFQPDSPSIAIFDFWATTSQAQLRTYEASATILIPATGKSYTLTKGILVNFKPLPDAKKVLEPQSYTLHWESVKPALV
jgi:hypothetical protein